ncbi:MAG: anti-sigma factor [Phycisphaeraceae bacterium]|nr:anti-sigma factor [Phycisphaeraceae bacterium]
MNTAPAPGPSMDRLLELLADRAVQNLSPAEQDELEAVSAAFEGFDLDCMDRTAAALAAGLAAQDAAPVPAAVRQRLKASGAAWAAATADPAPMRLVRTHDARRVRIAAWTGWFAAAAALLLAFAGWMGRGTSEDTTARGLAALRRAADTQSVVWSAGPTASESGNPTGEVVWCPSLQKGYMVFRGMKANDPTREQYQLWIFDATRDDRHPVDGGVFDVAGDGEVVVPIRAKLQVREATLFAVTVERPGGVVVSDRSRLPVLAPVKPTG